MITVDIPVVDETTARGRLDALMCEHGLPAYKHVWYRPDWTDGDANLRQLCPHVDPAVLHVTLNARADVATWGRALFAGAKTEHTIHEYDDGRWCAVWSEVILVPGWLPGVKLSVVHSEDRWIDRPAGAR